MKLTELLETKTIEDIVGQEHLTDNCSVFSRTVLKGNFESVIFTGPPGTGKTSMAKVVCEYLSLPFYRLHGASSGVTEIKNIVDSSRHYGKPSVIFIDEIHRFSKNQQDLLLKVIDDRHALLIGASTENPFFSLTPAFRSRSLFFNFNPIQKDAFRKIFSKISVLLKKLYDVKEVIIDPAVLGNLMERSSGDLRRFINYVEIASSMSKIKEGKILEITTDGLWEIIPQISYSTDAHYDLLSAMIKSIRGSDPDAALIWCFKLVKAGFSPEEIFRRLFISASEDIGNAFPDALVFVNAAYNAFLNTGLPEGLIILSNAVTLLASVPKSNRSYKAYHNVQKFLEKNDPYPPENIRQSSNGYKYPFDYGDFVSQNYADTQEIFYIPSSSGFETKIKERLERIWKDKKIYGKE